MRAVSLPFDSLIYPGDNLRIPVSDDVQKKGYVSISPSFPHAYDREQWKPEICEIVNKEALYEEHSNTPLLVKKHSHFCPHAVSIASISNVNSDTDVFNASRNDPASNS